MTCRFVSPPCKELVVEQWISFDQLQLQELEKPCVPENGVLIRAQAAGISFATSLVVQGKYQRKPPLPFTPGTEIAGIVEEVGDEAKRFNIGDRVCAVLDWGGLAEFAPAQEVNVYQIPDKLEFARAIAFTNSYATSAAALLWPHLLKLEAGETLLVHGASGGVGIAAVEIGKILGATVIATAGSAEKLAVARAHGADHAINYRTENFRDAVLDFTNGARREQGLRSGRGRGLYAVAALYGPGRAHYAGWLCRRRSAANSRQPSFGKKSQRGRAQPGALFRVGQGGFTL